MKHGQTPERGRGTFAATIFWEGYCNFRHSPSDQRSRRPHSKNGKIKPDLPHCILHCLAVCTVSLFQLQSAIADARQFCIDANRPDDLAALGATWPSRRLNETTPPSTPRRQQSCEDEDFPLSTMFGRPPFSSSQDGEECAR